MQKKIRWFLLLWGFGFLAVAGTPKEPEKDKAQTASKTERVLEQFNQGVFSLHPFGFVENKGQIQYGDGGKAATVHFEFRQGNTNIYLMNDGISYQFHKFHYPDGYLDMLKNKPKGKSNAELASLQQQVRIETHRASIKFVGANPNPTITREGQSVDVINYPALKISDIHHYAKITYQEIYPGIDWVIYTSGQAIKYDFIVKAGADPSLIKLQVTDQSELILNQDGSLALKTKLGTITEKAPVSFQGTHQVVTRFSVKENMVSFNLADYDHTKDLIIDPSIVWSTYYGGADFEIGNSATTDLSGNVYLCGETSSSVSIASGGYQNSLSNNYVDAFLVKFNSNGTRLWATYFGGPSYDTGKSCVCDASNNVYMCGMTSSNIGIASSGHDNTFAGTLYDAFLVKFNSSGSLLWSTYYGGENDDWGLACCTDASSNVYLVGNTYSLLDIASGGHQNSRGGNPAILNEDAFIVKFNSSGVRQWATYYGEYGGDCAYSVSTDASNNVFICGATSSTASIASGGHQNVYAGGYDGFLIKMNTSGTLQWATYYGGTGFDYFLGSCVDGSGNIYSSGYTESSASIASGGHDNTYGGNGDAFLVKFNTSGVRQWATYYGGAQSESQLASSCSRDITGNVYLTGQTESTTSIASGGFQNTFGGSGSNNYGDGFVVLFNSSGVRQWGSYFGGASDEMIRGCATDLNGNIYLAGESTSTSSIAAGGFQNTYAGNNDAFLTKICSSAPANPSAIFGSTNVCSGSNVTYSVTNDPIASSYSWTLPGGWSGSSSTNVISVSPSSSGIVSVSASNACGTSAASSLSVTLLLAPNVNISASSTLICSGQSVSLTASGANTYTWSTGSTNTTIVQSPVGSISRTVTGTAVNGCTNSAVEVITVDLTNISISPVSPTICSGESLTLNASGVSSYTWNGGPINPLYVVSPTLTTTYTVTGTSAVGCTASATETVVANALPALTISATSTLLCIGNTSTLTASGANTYTWSGGPSTASYAVNPTLTTTYTVNATAANGCTASASRQVSVNTAPVLTISATSTVLCSGNGATLTASGASTFTWTGGPSTASFVVSPTLTSTYSVIGTAATGCTAEATRQVSVNSIPNLTVSANPTVVCFGNSSTLTASGAVSYTWGGGPVTSTYVVTPNLTSNYTVVGTSAAGCTNSAVQQVSVLNTPTLNIASSATLICPAQSSTLLASGANTYTWSGGPSTASYAINPTLTTTYTVNATAVNGCTSSATQQVSVNTVPVLTISATSTVLCSGNTATLSGSGAITYTWIAGPTSNSYAVSPTVTTTFTLSGSSAAGCTASATRQVSVNPTPSLSISPSSTVICSGFTATLTASGATTYTWSSGPLTNTYAVSPLVNSNFTVTGSTNGCTNSAVQSLSVNATPVLTITPSSTVICTTKIATLLATGAVTYTWSGGPVFPSYTVSPATTTNYTVTGTASNGCTNTAQQSLSVNITPTITIVPTATVTCANVSQTLTASGANTYTWSGGPSTASYAISPTVTTIFTVTATALNTCTNSGSQSVSVIALPILTITPSSSVICSGFTSTLTASGANTYSWSGGPNSNTYAVTPSVTTAYTVNATAVTGCSNSAVGSISVNATPTLVISPSNTLYCIGTPYVITGSGAATYSWVGGPTTASYAVNPAVTTVYSLNAASSAGCLSSGQFTVVFNAPPVLTITPSSTVVCSNKTATLISTGANTYTWVSGPVSDTYLVVNPPVSSAYTVIGTAVNGCTAFATQNLSVNPAPVMTITPSASSICQWNTATLSAAGAPNYTWSGGPVNSNYTVSPFSTTLYTVTGTAVNGCTSSAVQTLSIISTPPLTVTASNSVLCSGSSSTLTASGAVSYTWTGGPVNPVFVISPTLTGNYAVVATSANGCTQSAVQMVSVNATPVVSIVPSSSVICSNISSTLLALGAGSYTWAGGPVGPGYVVTPSVTTSYSVTGSSNGCSNTAVQTVSVNAAPSVSIVPSNTSICVGSSITLSGAGATTYTWNTGSNSPSITVSPSLTTSYTLFGTTGAAGGCSNVAVTTLTVHPSPVISVNSGSVCEGNTFTISPIGAASYSITGGSWVVSPTVTSFYTVTATSTLGCLSLNSPVSTVIVHPRPTLTVNSGSICPGGVFVIQPTGASTYTYSSGSPTVYPLVNSTYSVTGTSSLGCASSNTALSQVVILPTPTIVVSNGSICIGGSFVINPSGAATYTYSSGSPTVNPVTTSTYYVSGSNAVGCVSSNTPALVVTVFPNPTISVNSGTVCLGGSMVLTAGGANSYSWNTGAGTASISVTPSVLTHYTVTGTDLNSCSASASSTVMVVPQLSVNISASSPTLCQGGTTTLSAFGANNFTWSTGSTSPSIVANLSVTTSYSVFGASGAACTNTAVQVVTVIPLPMISIGGQGFGCAGNNFTLIASGASTYTWNTSATGSVLVVNPASSTAYTVTGSNGFNCANTATIQVNVTTPVTPSICMVTVDSVGQYNEIYWEKALYPEADTFYVYRETNVAQYSIIARIPKNDPSVYLDTNRHLGPYIGDPNLTSYKYKMRYLDTCGNLSNWSSYHQTIHVQDQQNGNFSWNPYFVEWGGASVGYMLWSYNVLTGVTNTIGFTSGTNYTDPNYLAIAATGNTKWYVSTSGFNCNANQQFAIHSSAAAKTRTKSNNTNERQFPGGNGSPTQLEEQYHFISKVLIYPNPVDENLYIQSAGAFHQVILKITDLTGRIVFEQEMEGTNFTFNTKDLVNGSYFVSLLPQGKSGKTVKIIIQH